MAVVLYSSYSYSITGLCLLFNSTLQPEPLSSSEPSKHSVCFCCLCRSMRLLMSNRSLLNKEGITNFAPLSAREVTMVDGRMRAERLQIMLDPDELAALDD